MKTIAVMKSDFPTKFGLPRQSGLVEELHSEIVFTKEYSVPAALRGLEGYSHIWVIWGFSEAERPGWSPTVRPPRLGGNTRMGVFATRSPFRPNALGLSCVKLISIHADPQNCYLEVAGADLMDGTPIYDIKPYLPFADSHPEATDGFAGGVREDTLTVSVPEKLLAEVPEEKREGLLGVLRGDPRPSYQHDPKRVYGFCFGEQEIRFTVDGTTLTVCEILPRDGEK